MCINVFNKMTFMVGTLLSDKSIRLTNYFAQGLRFPFHVRVVIVLSSSRGRV